MSLGQSCKSLQTFSVSGRVRPEITIWELPGFFLTLPYVLSVTHSMIKSTGEKKTQLCKIVVFFICTAKAQTEMGQIKVKMLIIHMNLKSNYFPTENSQ